jgi:choloylglycine hydrolase
MGIAHVEHGFPLYYDAINEHGLAIAGLRFADFAFYHSPAKGKDNITHFELILWILAQCANLTQVRQLVGRLNITDLPFSPQFPPSSLHWLIADRQESVTLESTADGLHLYPNPIGVLTNAPPFPMQMLSLANFMYLTPHPPQNRFPFPLPEYSLGMGAIGLPGDLSSPSRFVRAAFTKANAESDASLSVSQVFHIAEAVSQTKGCCILPDHSAEFTRYTICANLCKGIYYYTTYGRRSISAVAFRPENTVGNILTRYPMLQDEPIAFQN